MIPPVGLSSEVLWWLLHSIVSLFLVIVCWQMKRLIGQLDAHDQRVRLTQQRIVGLETGQADIKRELRDIKIDMRRLSDSLLDLAKRTGRMPYLGDHG